MKFQLSPDTGRSHTQILQRASESALLMPLEMIHRYHYIGISYGCTYLRRRTISATARDFLIVSTFQTVSNNDIGMGSYTVESVFHSCMEMVYSIGTATGIQSVGIGEKRLAAKTSDDIHYTGSIVGAYIGQISRLSEMDLDGNEFPFEINF